jgi:hypothetical protein
MGFENMLPVLREDCFGLRVLILLKLACDEEYGCFWVKYCIEPLTFGLLAFFMLTGGGPLSAFVRMLLKSPGFGAFAKEGFF